MALPEELLIIIAKNQFNKDPYISDLLMDCLSSVVSYYNKKNDQLLNKTLEILADNIRPNTLTSVLSLDKLNIAIINQLEPKELLKAQILVTGHGKTSEDQEEKERLRKLYKAIIEKREKNRT